MRVDNDDPADRDEGESEEYGELLKFTFAGFAGGLIAATILDWFGLQRSGWGQWLVRTLSGEGESIFEGIYALRQRLRSAGASMAEAYGWGKVTGMAFPWLVDAGSRVGGLTSMELRASTFRGFTPCRTRLAPTSPAFCTFGARRAVPRERPRTIFAIP